MKIAGISSTKLGDANEGLLKNQNLYNDKELIDEGDLNWYDLGYRNYDPQTGRFLQIDPLTDIFPDFSPYAFAGDEPIGNIDVDGLAPIPGLNGTWANLGEVIIKPLPKVAQVAKTGSTALKITNIAVKTANVVYNSLVGVARTFNTYVIPLSPFVEIATGKSVESDFTEDKSRVVSGAEGAIMLIPGGKVAGTIAKTAERVVFKTAAKEGATVLGHYPEYVKLAEQIGARRFQIPTNVWNKMSAAEQWTANTKFLDRMILRGDNIRLATPLNQVKPGSFFQKELNYLFDKGYKVSSDGLWLVK